MNKHRATRFLHLGALLIFGGATALRFIAQPLRDLIARYVLIGDAFYHLKIGQSLAAEHLSSFDGIHLTNGYHPLWALLLAVVSSNRVTGDLYVWTALLISIVLCVTAALLIYAADADSLLPEFSRFLPALLCVTSLAFFLSVVNGLETSLAAMLLTLLFWVLFRRRACANRPTSMPLLLALLAAALIWTRLDYVIVVVFVAALLLTWDSFRTRSKHPAIAMVGDPRDRRHDLAAAIVSAGSRPHDHAFREPSY